MIHCYGEATSQVNVNYASTQNYETMFTLLTEPGIEDLRLVNGTYGSHMGRVEVLYNGTWGTICNSGWRWPEARAACKYVCYRTGWEVLCLLGLPFSAHLERCRQKEKQQILLGHTHIQTFAILLYPNQRQPTTMHSNDTLGNTPFN